MSKKHEMMYTADAVRDLKDVKVWFAEELKQYEYENERFGESHNIPALEKKAHNEFSAIVANSVSNAAKRGVRPLYQRYIATAVMF